VGTGELLRFGAALEGGGAALSAARGGDEVEVPVPTSALVA